MGIKMRTLAILMALVMAFGLAAPAHAEGTAALAPAKAPEDLVDLEIPKDQFTLDTTGGKVLTAEMKTTEAGIEYCEVFGVIYPVDPEAPNIEFRFGLPTAWNGRAVQFGTGGNAGSIPNITAATSFSAIIPLDAGYVAFADDSGHQSESSMDAEFAANDEALENWLNGHLLKCYDAMQAVVAAYYGQAPEFVIFAGSSNGGREALVCATTYGQYYDGIFSSEASANFMLLRLWGAILSRTVYESYDADSYPHSDGFIPEDVVLGIQADAIARYDALDGIEDGIVANVYEARMQREAFLAELTEKYNLTEAQLATLDVYENGYTLPYQMDNGYDSYRGYLALEGGLMDLGPDEVPREPLDTEYNVHHGDRADGTFKYFIMRDPEFVLIDHDYMNPDEALLERILDTSARYDANKPAFDDFIENGGKMILFAGWHDMSISPLQLVRMYESYVEAYGQETVDSFIKFYAMPSITHGSGMSVDYLTAIDTWLTTGEYPEDPLYATMKVTGGEMPMAEFPGWVQYVEGDPMEGSSYTVNFDVPEGYAFD